MKKEEAGHYIKSCQTDFWQEIFRIETEYLAGHLDGCHDVLSVGCGPAFIERGLIEKGFNVTGLDVSIEALAIAPDSIRTVVAKAENMPFPEASFDAAIYVASLQFMENYAKAVEKTVMSLRQNGRIIVMLLNPESSFFRKKNSDPDSYISNIKHMDLKEIESAVSENFDVVTEYLSGVRETFVFRSQKPEEAVLYIIRGRKKSCPEIMEQDSADYRLPSGKQK